MRVMWTGLLMIMAWVPHSALAGDPADRCRRDDECVFSFRSPCFCQPCGKARRTAIPLATYRRYAAGWAIKVPRCKPCKACKVKTAWTGAAAVCRKGRCVVEGDSPRPLRSLIGLGVNRVVYTMEIVFRDGGFWPLKMPRMPRHHASRFEWHGAELGRAVRKVGARHRFEFIVIKREINKVPGRRQWRATYHGRVVAAKPAS